jgi:hypothetical protein
MTQGCEVSWQTVSTGRNISGHPAQPSFYRCGSWAQRDEATWTKVTLGERGKVIIINYKLGPKQSGIPGSLLTQNLHCSHQDVWPRPLAHFLISGSVFNHHLPLVPSHWGPSRPRRPLCWKNVLAAICEAEAPGEREPFSLDLLKCHSWTWLPAKPPVPRGAWWLL